MFVVYCNQREYSDIGSLFYCLRCFFLSSASQTRQKSYKGVVLDNREETLNKIWIYIYIWYTI